MSAINRDFHYADIVIFFFFAYPTVQKQNYSLHKDHNKY